MPETTLTPDGKIVGILFHAMKALLICSVLVSPVFCQQWAINSNLNPGGGAAATSTSRTRYAPSSFEIRKNALAQERASILQAISEAQACVQNNSNPQILRDQQGNVRSVPSADVANCKRTLNALKRQLVSNLQAADNLDQDVQLDSIRAARIKKKADYARRLKRLSMPGNY
ncbi:MAG: hypothetical protein ACP5U1_05845 [Desulfomonilaceae bacterium]